MDEQRLSIRREVGLGAAPWSMRAAIVVRLIFAMVVAAALTYVMYRVLPAHLSSNYGVIGFPSFANLNSAELLREYELVAIVFPMLVVVTYGAARVVSSWVGLPVGRLFAAQWKTRSEDDIGRRARAPVLAGCLPSLLIGAVAGLQVAMWQARAPRALLVEVAAFSLTWLVMSLIIGRALVAMGAASDWASGVHLANVATAPATIVLITLISATTTVTIAGTHRSVTYQWFPVWVSVPLACAVGTAAWVWLGRRKRDNGPKRADHALVALTVVPIALFLLTARLPGGMGPMDTFAEGEYLAAGSLVAQGYRYLVDLVSIHGLFLDVWTSQIGFALFGRTRWGAWAGQVALLYPLGAIGLYYLVTYLFWRRWHWILLLAVMIVAGSLAPAGSRYIAFPVPFLLLGLTLKTRRGLFALLTAVVAVGYSLAVPELTYVIAGVGAGVILADLQGWRRDRNLIRNLRLSLFCLAGGVASLAFLAGWLVATGSAGAFVQYYLDFIPAHAASGALPLGGYLPVTSVDLEQLAISLAGLIGVIWYFGRMFLRGERPSDRDVVVGALAVVAFLYYPQFVSRMDSGHLANSYLVILPVALYLVARVLSWMKLAPERRLGRGAALGVQWLAVAIVALIAVGGTPAAVQQQVRAAAQASSNFRQTANFAPTNSRMGYETTFPSDTDQLANDLKPFLSRYVGRDQWLFDFTNSPGLFYYLLNIHPRTRFYNVSLAYTAATQTVLVDQLRQHQPRVVAFDDQISGLPSWDRIPNEVREYMVSRYLLANYRPLAEIDSYAFFVRKDVTVPAPPAGGFRSSLWPAVPDASQLYWGPRCSWGSALNYLTSDQPRPGSLQAKPTVDESTAVRAQEGWALDTVAQSGASQVLAVQGGKVVSTANAGLRGATDNPLSGPIGAEFTGFLLPIHGTSDGPVSVVGLNTEGDATVLSGSAPLPSGSSIPGTGYRVKGHSIEGAVTGATRLTEQVISPPRGGDWARYGWLGVRLGHRSELEHVTVSDGNAVQPLGTPPDTGPSHVISFDAVPGPARTFYVPVASCPQWFGYGSVPLTVTVNATDGTPAVSLVQ